MKNKVILSYLSIHFKETDSKTDEFLFEIFDNENEVNISHLNSLSEYVFNTDSASKGMKRAIAKLLSFDTPDLTALHLTRVILNSCPNLSPDNFIQLFNNQKTTLNPTPLCKLRINQVKLLLEHMSTDRLLKLIWSHNGDLELLSDTILMMKKVKTQDKELWTKYLPKKIKSIRQIHDMSSRIIERFSEGDFDLNQREDILKLDNKTLGDDLTIRVPETHFDLVKLGESLSFCIGNGYYSTKVKNKKSSIISIFRDKKPVYAIEFSRYHILQAHGWGNRTDFEPPKSVLLSLEKLIIKQPECPDDFLPITDSRWINGYKYDNNNLYLLLNHNIYVYFDVPKEVYEGLLESKTKGRFVNAEIKPHYECERVR